MTPGPLAPARELYGDMLLERGMAKEALAAYQATMTKEPNRFNGFLGAAKAAVALGDKATARADYEKLIALTADSDSDRPALVAARAFVASGSLTSRTPPRSPSLAASPNPTVAISGSVKTLAATLANRSGSTASPRACHIAMRPCIAATEASSRTPVQSPAA